MKTILTIAGFDPSSGAGVTADLATITAHEFFGTSAITALTVQSTLGVRAVHPTEASILRDTLDCLAEDLPPAGIKIGMLATEANVRVVVDFLRPFRTDWGPMKVPVVLDPILRSSSGAELLSASGVIAMRQQLLPLVTWITPNVQELAVLRGSEIRTEQQMESAAIWMVEEWCDLGVVATGGHLESPNDFWVQPGGKAGGWYPGQKIASAATHGTGCAFSTALLCGLVNDLSGQEAVKRAKEFVRQGILRAEPLGGGKGPMNLLWPLRT